MSRLTRIEIELRSDCLADGFACDEGEIDLDASGENWARLLQQEIKKSFPDIPAKVIYHWTGSSHPEDETIWYFDEEENEEFCCSLDCCPYSLREDGNAIRHIMQRVFERNDEWLIVNDIVED